KAAGVVEAALRRGQLVLVVDVRGLLQLPDHPQFLVPAVALQGRQGDQVAGGGLPGTCRVVAGDGGTHYIGDDPVTVAHGHTLAGSWGRTVRPARVRCLHDHCVCPPSVPDESFASDRRTLRG